MSIFNANLPEGQSLPPNEGDMVSYVEGEIIDQLRLYDDMIFKWLETFRFPPNLKRLELPDHRKGDKTLFIVFASPEKGYGETRNLVNENEREAVRTRDNVIKPQYPAASIWRRGPARDYTRWHWSPVRKAGYVDEERTEVYQSPYPEPWDFPYQIEVTTINRLTLNYIQQWLMLQFDSNKFWLHVNPCAINSIVYPTPILIPVELETIDDNSDLEHGEEPRLMRLTLDITVKGWLFRPARRVKTVHHIDYEVYEGCPEGDYSFMVSFDP